MSEAEKQKEAEAQEQAPADEVIEAPPGVAPPPAVVKAEPVPMDADIAPPTYLQATQQQEKCPLSYVDFIPAILAMDDPPEFDKFYTVIDQANDWLTENPHMEPVNCETVERKVEEVIGYRNKFEMVDMQIMSHTELTFDKRNYYVKGLRVWVRSRSDEDMEKPAPQIGYLDASPDKGGSSEERKQYPAFANFGSAIAKLNGKMRAEGLAGKLMSVQAVELRVGNSYFSDSMIDPENCIQVTEPKCIQMHFYFARAYYIKGDKTKPDIRYKDFQPKCTARVPKTADKNTDPKFEKVSVMFKNVNTWLAQNPNIEYLNTQTISTRNQSWSWIDSEGWPRYDPECMDREQSEINRFDRILRVMRVFYLAKKSGSEEGEEALNLVMQIFAPLPTGRSFEKLNMTSRRMQQYIKGHMGMEIKSCETVIFDYRAGGNPLSECDLAFARIEKAKSLYFFYAIRLYLHQGKLWQPPPGGAQGGYPQQGGYQQQGGYPQQGGYQQQGGQAKPQKSSTCVLL